MRQRQIKSLLRKGIAVVLSLSSAMLLMTGCGASGDSSAAPETAAAGTSAEGEVSAEDGGKLVFVDWGGTNTDARVEAIVDKFAEKYNVDVTVVTPSDYAKLISMVENGTTEWDVMNCDAYWGVYAGNEGYLEPMNYDVITTKIDDEVQLDYVMGAEIYSSCIAWNSDKYTGDAAPQNWEQFFDTTNYPGTRAIWQYPVTVLEAALLADGVPMNQLYPLDLDRAFAKLDTIKDDIVWWTAGAQPSQMLSTGEADYALAWSGRILTAEDEGSPVDMTYDGAIRIAAGWVVPKDCPNYDNAMKFIEFASEAEQQYEFSKRIPYGSTNSEATELMDDELKERLGQTDEQLATEIYLNNEYWAEHLSEVEERFNAWLTE